MEVADCIDKLYSLENFHKFDNVFTKLSSSLLFYCGRVNKIFRCTKTPKKSTPLLLLIGSNII